jgi:hypothetical protein
MRFWYPFFDFLDRFEGHNRTGTGLFFILMTFRCLNLKKKYVYVVKILPSKEFWNCYHPGDFLNAECQHSYNTRVMNPGVVTIRRTFSSVADLDDF